MGDAIADGELKLTNAIYRVDGNRVIPVRMPPARGIPRCSMARRRPRSWSGPRESIADAGADADRARHHRPDASGAARATALETEVLREGRKIQLCAVRLIRWRRRGRRHRAQDQARRRSRCRRMSPTRRSTCRGRSVVAGARGFLDQSVRRGCLAARRARTLRRARSWRDLVPGRAPAGRGAGDLAGDARGGRRAISATAPRPRWISGNGPSSTPTSP